MSERAAYSRVYWSVMDDPKFDGIREDVRHFGAWAFLLIVADMAHPAPAYVPQHIPRAAYRALVSAGLVDELPGGRFRIHGLEAERNRRRDAATRPGSHRPPPGPQAGPKRDPVALQDEDETRTRRDETTARASNDPWDDPEHEAVVWLAKHGCDLRAGNGFLNHVITLVEEFGVNAVVGMFDRLAREGIRNGDTKGFVFKAKDALYARTRPNIAALEKEEAAEERADVRSKRIARQMWERRHELFRETGQWDDAWGDRPSKEGAA